MTSTPEAVRTAADRLFEAAVSGTPTAPIRDLLAEGDVAAAYAVQA
ncbi:MAG: 2-keto-4-pentenoate hydratase, partial [Phyllobacteriaceae bacterium]|nr:2-keto-4-pentenoate hydratase [Phyllobacteriaceae bacterium]NLH82424.1 2-keto-4-pentenoate hydratase [Phyllobacteriaceae bacterium]